jgi:hypothetical protein
MPSVGFELTIPMFERVKKLHVLDRAATVIGGVMEILFHNFPGKPEHNHEKSVRVGFVTAKIQTENHQNISVERYHFANQLRVNILQGSRVGTLSNYL